jgi:peroxiredoxin
MSLSVGDIAPACVLPDLDGTIVDLRRDAIAGNPIVIIFCPGSAPSIDQLMAGYCSRLQTMSATDARFFAVTLCES